MTFSRLLKLSVIFIFLAAASYFYFDKTAVAWIQAHQTPELVLAGKVVQWAFTFKIWAVLAPLMLLIMWWRASDFKVFRNSKVTEFFLAILLAMFFCGIIKTLLGRYRPEMYLAHSFYGFTGFAPMKDLLNSMPSDHSAIVFSIVTTLAFYCRTKFMQVILVLIGFALIAMRVMYLRHYPSDVLIGALVGIWAATLSSYYCKLR